MDKTIRKAIEDIYRINLGVRKKERVLIFTDDFDKRVMRIARLFKKVGEGLLKGQQIQYVEFPATGSHGFEPPEPLWIEAFGEGTVKRLKSKGLFNLLLNKKRINSRTIKRIERVVHDFKKDVVHVVIALSYFSTTHTRFRDLLTNICGVRYASMPLFDMPMLRRAMRVDWKEMEKRTRKIARKINRYEIIELSTPNGTFLRFSKKGRYAKADTGILTKKGSVSNLPAGEVYLAPVEGTASGRLVLEWAPTRKLKTPIILDVEKGVVKGVSGEDEYTSVLRRKFSERPENRNIAEFGIGTNDMASRPDNILESEKILGTAHIALGDNSSFGGRVRTPFHQDFIFFKPRVILMNKHRRTILIKDGRL
jgi:leucyl aminopeptidase (aminopeptidase T)